MIADNLKSRWYETCQEFYLNSNEEKRAAIGFFESLNPENSTCLPPHNESKLAGFDSSFFDCIRIDPKFWYELSEIKNQARSDSHVISSQRRIKALQEKIHTTNQNNFAHQIAEPDSSTSYVVSWTALRKYLR
jgi:hypothetical protein